MTSPIVAMKMRKMRRWVAFNEFSGLMPWPTCIESNPGSLIGCIAVYGGSLESYKSLDLGVIR